MNVNSTYWQIKVRQFISKQANIQCISVEENSNNSKHKNGIVFNIKTYFICILTHFTVLNSEIKEKYTDIL